MRDRAHIPLGINAGGIMTLQDIKEICIKWPSLLTLGTTPSWQ